MIFKILAVLAVLFLVYMVFFKKSREGEISRKQNKKENDKVSDVMEECPTCKTFVSRKESILSSGKYYCSKECL